MHITTSAKGPTGPKDVGVTHMASHDRPGAIVIPRPSIRQWYRVNLLDQKKKKKRALQVCYDLMRRKSCLVISDLDLHTHTMYMYTGCGCNMSIGSVIYMHRVHWLQETNHTYDTGSTVWMQGFACTRKSPFEGWRFSEWIVIAVR